jgi:2-polyprenyl-6-methoxyphenol hydroxylase-like FAD-dependent oxidoreductase
MRARRVKIAIIGGGVGGMALALSLNAAGFDDVDIYESSPAIRELGVGINVLPHGVRELDELGLLDELAATGVLTADFSYYSKLGQRIWGEPLGIAAGYHWPQVSIHRGELLGVLHRAVTGRLGAERIHTTHHLQRFGQDEGRALWAEFTDHASGSIVGRTEADLLVGCDGIHSVVRGTLYPNEGPPRWSGLTMWRGTTPANPFLSGRSMVNIGSTKQRVVIYPIGTDNEHGRPLINWVAIRKVAASQEMPPQDWTYTAATEEVTEDFASFIFDFLDVPALVRDTQFIYKYPMVDRDPLPSWNFGRVTLLGDAAHPMYPVGGNGASQAIIDGRVLARELALQSSIEAALGAYDTQRRPLTAAVAQSNRRAGPHRCQDLVEERAPDGFTDLSQVITDQELEEIAADYKRTAGFEIESLNSRPSLTAQIN